MIKTGQQSDC